MLEVSELERLEIIQGWVNLLQNQASLLSSDVSIGYTLLFGYLLVAHFVGKSLSKPQSVILTTLYITAFSLNAFGIISNKIGSIEIYDALMAVCSECASNPAVSVQYMMLQSAAFLAMLIASLYFMWSIRNSKTE